MWRQGETENKYGFLIYLCQNNDQFPEYMFIGQMKMVQINNKSNYQNRYFVLLFGVINLIFYVNLLRKMFIIIWLPDPIYLMYCVTNQHLWKKGILIYSTIRIWCTAALVQNNRKIRETCPFLRCMYLCVSVIVSPLNHVPIKRTISTTNLCVFEPKFWCKKWCYICCRCCDSIICTVRTA